MSVAPVPVGNGPLWMIGCGNMGGAMLRRWIATGMATDRVTVVTRGPATLPGGVRHAARAATPDAQPGNDRAGVKPQQLDGSRRRWRASTPALLVSILAGVEDAGAGAPDPGRRDRPRDAEPAGRDRQGRDGAASTTTDPDVRAAADALAAPLGLVEWIADEALFDAVTALAGSRAGVRLPLHRRAGRGGAALGLPADQARGWRSRRSGRRRWRPRR